MHRGAGLFRSLAVRQRPGSAARNAREKSVALGGRSGRCLGGGPEVDGAAAHARATPFCPVGRGPIRPAGLGLSGRGLRSRGPPAEPETQAQWRALPGEWRVNQRGRRPGPSRRGRSCSVGPPGRPAAPLGVVNSLIHSENVYQALRVALGTRL